MGRRQQKYIFFKIGHTNSPYNRNICHNMNIDLLWESTGRTNVNFLEKKNLSGGFHICIRCSKAVMEHDDEVSTKVCPRLTASDIYIVWFGIMILAYLLKITFRKIYINHFIACRGLYRCKQWPRFMQIIMRLFTQRGTGLRWSPFSQMP